MHTQAVHPCVIISRGLSLRIEREIEDHPPAFPIRHERGVGDVIGVANVAEHHVDLPARAAPYQGVRVGGHEVAFVADAQVVEQQPAQLGAASTFGVLIGHPLEDRPVVHPGQLQADGGVSTIADLQLPHRLRPLTDLP